MVCKRVAVLQAIPVDLFHHDSLGANRLSGTWTHGVLSINVFLVSRHTVGDAGYAYVLMNSKECRSSTVLGLAFHALEDCDCDWIIYPGHPTICCAIAPKHRHCKLLSNAA